MPKFFFVLFCFSSHAHTVLSCFKSLLTVSGLREVHISISEGAPGDHVSADPNGEHRSGGAELLVQHSLRYVWVQVANVERSHRITPRRSVHFLELPRIQIYTQLVK